MNTQIPLSLVLAFSLTACDSKEKADVAPEAPSAAEPQAEAPKAEEAKAEAPKAEEATPAAKEPEAKEPEAAPSPLGDLAIEWVAFEGGPYAMVMDNEAKTEYAVTLNPFEIGKTEVTNAQYQRCVDAGACTEINYRQCTDNQKQREKLSGPQQPVVCVDWAQADAFAKWVGGTLPTEAQWAFAASSGGEKQPYPWGDAKPSCELAVMNWGCKTNASMDVCSKPQGNTPAGLCDMAGNVSELMADVAGWDGETEKRGTKINRGGSWHGIDPLYYKNSPKGESMLRTEHRSRYGPRMRDNSMGFRVARTKDGKPALAPDANEAG